jgi:hypothetical protein
LQGIAVQLDAEPTGPPLSFSVPGS